MSGPVDVTPGTGSGDRTAALPLSVERLLGAGRAQAAAALCGRWIALDPAAVPPHVALSAIAERGGDLAAALAHLDDALARAPGRPDLLVARGAILRRVGDLGRAIEALEEAIAREPEHARAHGQLGLALLDRGDDVRAVAHLERAHSAAPSEVDPARSLAAALARSGSLARAAAVLDALLASNPADAALVGQRAQVALDAQDADGAIRWLARASALDPGSHAFAGKLALTQLQAGRLSDGWASLRHRLDAPGRDGRAALFPQPIWEGGSLSGRTIALWRQFGIGEEVLFAGMLPDVLAEGGHAVVECDRRLRPLLERSFPTLRFVDFQGPLARPLAPLLDPAIDCKCAVADLGGRYRTEFDRFPRRDRYLRPDPARVDRLAARHRRAGRPTIGIAWRSEGAPSSERKSVPLAEWGPIFAALDATWVDLQHGDPADGRSAAAMAHGIALSRDPEIDTREDLDGLAALVEALDLVVSISTTTVHVAGAVGTPAFVMAPDRLGVLWHWFVGRADSPWYPSVRLFRQSGDGDWSGPIAAVGAALADWRCGRARPS